VAEDVRIAPPAGSGGSPWDIYQDYIDGKREIREINEEYMDKYRQGRNIH